MHKPARERLFFVSLAASLTLGACGLFGDKEEKEDASPPPSTPPSAAPSSVSSALPLPSGTPAAPVVPGNPPVTAGTSAKPDAGAPADAGASTDAGKADAAAPADAGASSTKLKACADKCQGVMASCLTPSFAPDSGFPQIKDPAACQAAAEACRAACAP